MTQPRIGILDALSDPGNRAKPNEDRFGHNEAAAFVIDGATGLGDRQYVAGAGSDAAWIAGHFAEGFERQITAQADLPAIVRSLSEKARADFLANHPEAPRYAWPLSAFAMVKAGADGFYFHGLGDSCVFLLKADGTASFHIPIPGVYAYEQAQARRHIERNGGITKGGGTLGNAETLALLRQSRERQNTAGGSVWTLGLAPEAADHIVGEKLDIAGTAHAVICSDGLSDLVVLYAAYDPAGLVRTALDRGLASLVAELRHFERQVDPEGLRFPRYKQSDDTTALLVELTV